MDEVQKKLEINFFIRYYDNKGEHLRIRIKFNNEHIAYSKVEVIINWAKELINSRVINSIIFDIYEREINRYGGKEVIEACERVFFKDSKLIESFYAINKKMEPSILEEYYIKGIAFILRNLTDSEDEMFSIINTGNYSAEKYRKKYRKNHKKYINYINEILDDKANGYFTNIEALDEKEALINYKFQLKEQFANGKCTNDYFRIVNSIMHMYCNRLTGNRELEEEYFALVRHALYHIKERSELDILK
ncbi:thiopeptide-type bacteriocin biosynthesis protein [Dorea longicatena]|uniref:thiopeptide-type bacteriocin biosynthesis protein n=1 Tax=Dorea longicatena TaxID=88431 RepID=UPI0011112C7F